MARYALVHVNETRVQAIAENEQGRFDVHHDMVWHECPDHVEFMWEYNWETGEWSEPFKPETRYEVARKVAYGEVGAQLDSIFKAVQNGDSDPLGAWAERISRIKALFPKDNHQAMLAANDELTRRVNIMLAAHDANPDDPQHRIRLPNEMADELANDFVEGRWDNPVTGPYSGS
jgi:hypothetical protein